MQTPLSTPAEAAKKCCNHSCEQGKTCPIRTQRKAAPQADLLARLNPTPAQQQQAQAAAKERATDDTYIAWGRVLLAGYFAGVLAVGLYLSLS